MAEDAKPYAPVPVQGGLVAYLTVDGALRAAEFYARAFGAETVAGMPPDEQGRTMHVHLVVNGSSLMLGDGFPEHGHPAVPLAGTVMTLMVEDIQAWWDRALAAGATPIMAPKEMFWGDTYARLTDPFGVPWALNQIKR
jgi:uncharacterized glyoxalase superfamily protein PhnB